MKSYPAKPQQGKAGRAQAQDAARPGFHARALWNNSTESSPRHVSYEQTLSNFFNFQDFI